MFPPAGRLRNGEIVRQPDGIEVQRQTQMIWKEHGDDFVPHSES
jgi:hypothetical protein